MSKVSDLKAAAGYVDVAPTCASCRELLSEMKLPKWMLDHNIEVASGRRGLVCDSNVYRKEQHGVEKSIRCGLNDPDLFKVKKAGWCPSHKPK